MSNREKGKEKNALFVWQARQNSARAQKWTEEPKAMNQNVFRNSYLLSEDKDDEKSNIYLTWWVLYLSLMLSVFCVRFWSLKIELFQSSIEEPQQCLAGLTWGRLDRLHVGSAVLQWRWHPASACTDHKGCINADSLLSLIRTDSLAFPSLNSELSSFLYVPTYVWLTSSNL